LVLLGVLLAAVAIRGPLLSLVGEPAAGLTFAGLLLGASALARLPRGRPRPAALAAGVGVGLGLLLPGIALRALGMPALGAMVPTSTLVIYAAALLVIAPAEEVYLRGLLQPALRSHVGPGPAIAVTALAFVAIHVPVYGPVAVPLDLGVGILLGWLRERTGSTAACAVAHLVADLGAWFLP
jgi:membrane protease YdiL (CAAX protease family)